MNLGYQPTQKERFIDDLCNYNNCNKKFLIEALLDACIIDDDGNLEPFLIKELLKTKYLKQLIEFGEEILTKKENNL